ncbi:MAG: hypothetical protein JO283_11930 [Bradyrhizobium sp.]|nr:hypothetical protein [Bradyrhizobium sp.]
MSAHLEGRRDLVVDEVQKPFNGASAASIPRVSVNDVKPDWSMKMTAA